MAAEQIEGVAPSKAAKPFVAVAMLLAACVLVSGCAETKLAATVAKSGNENGTSRGIYKIGEPYQIQGVWYYPAEDYNYDETGIASWYGPDFHGKYTANGEIYDMNDLTAAHHTLPLPSLVRVTNLDNGRSIVVRINDRGPFAKGRILDMSRRAAQLLGYEQTGTAKVRVQILAEESRQLAAQMKGQGAVQVAGGARPYRVDTQPGETAPINAPRAAVTATSLMPPPGSAPGSTPGSTASTPSVASAALPPAGSASVSSTPLAPPPSGLASAPGPLTPPPGTLVPPSVAARTPALTQVAAQEVTQTVPKKGSQIYIQAGAFTNQDNAQRLSSQLRTVGPTRIVPITVSNHQFYRVRIGPLASVEAGDKALDQVVAAGHPEARIVVD